MFFKEDSEAKSEAQIENKITELINPHVIPFLLTPHITGTEVAVNAEKRKI